MKNYHLQQIEIIVAYMRLDTLEEKKKMLADMITSCTSKMKDGVFDSSFSNDKMDKYLIEIEEIDEEIAIKKKEIEMLEINLKKMESALRGLKGTEERIFVLRYIDGLKPKEIAPKIPCDISTVYRYLEKINKTI